MKFYQLDLRKDYGTSAGFEYFSTKRAAQKAYAEWFDCGKDKSVAEEWTEERVNTKITVINIKPTRVGILWALRRYADHPDNG